MGYAIACRRNEIVTIIYSHPEYDPNMRVSTTKNATINNNLKFNFLYRL